MTESVMPVLQYSVACQRVQQSKPGVLTLDGVSNHDYSAPRSNPALVFFIVNCWTDGLGEWQDQVTIYRPDGSEALRTKQTPVKLVSAENSHVVIHQIPLAIQESGLHSVEVLLGPTVVARYKLRMTLRDGAQQAEGR